MLAGLGHGLLSVAFAALVETRILAWMWGVSMAAIIKRVVIANIISAIVGVVPVTFAGLAQGPGIGADAWHTYQHDWLRHLSHVLILFAITSVVEFLVYLVPRRSLDPAPTRWALWNGTCIANVVSYALLAAYVLARPGLTGQFEFVPNTHWLAHDETRVYFRDPHDSRLWSIRLDGADRRLEMPEPLAALNDIWQDVGGYALLKNGDVLFVAADMQWKLWHDHHVMTLSPYDENERVAATACEWWSAASAHLRNQNYADAIATQPIAGQAYISPSRWWPWVSHDDRGDLTASASVYWIDGSGSGLAIRNSSTGETLTFRVPVGLAALACRNPLFVDENLVVFRCGSSILVMDLVRRKVGQLVTGDSVVMRVDGCDPARDINNGYKPP